jgi:hypothetical protein
MTTNESSSWDVLIDRDDLHHITITHADQRPLVDGEARLAIDAFGLSANNVTYAAFGDTIGYWGFSPAGERDDGTNWGRVPVWGFADVVESTVSALPVGERVYGYLPMSTELVVTPSRIKDGGLSTLPLTGRYFRPPTTTTHVRRETPATPPITRTHRCCCARSSSRRS